MGISMIAIHRRSYRKPIKKEGITSPKEIPFGLNAIKVASLNNVKINRKMTKRFATHKMVFGILYFTSISFCPSNVIMAIMKEYKENN